MKKILFFFAIALSLSTISHAKQLPVAKSLPCPCEKTFQGLFVGGNAGYGIGVIKSRENSAIEGVWAESRIGFQGFDGGLNAGYLHRFGNVCLGLEGVFNWSAATGDNYANNNGTRLAEGLKLRNSVQVRIPIAYVISELAAPKLLVGWNNSAINKYSTDIGQNNGRYNGILWGAGIDLLLLKNLIGGVEYTGVAFSGQRFAEPDTGGQNFTTGTPIYNKVAVTLKYMLSLQ